MVSSPSPNLQLQNPATGDQVNAWGPTLDTNFNIVDQALTGLLSLSVAGSSNVILADTIYAVSNAKNALFNFTGVLTGSILILWPNGLNRTFSVLNSTTGLFSITLGVNNGGGALAGTGVVIPQGQSMLLYSDGTNVVPRFNATAGLTINGNETITGTLGVTGTSSFTGAMTAAAIAATSINFGGTNLTAYAEGSWTPTLGGDGTFGTQTYTTQVGRYIRIGNTVTIWGAVLLSATSGTATGNMIMGGLPFTSSNISGLQFPLSAVEGFITWQTNFTQFGAQILSNSSNINLLQFQQLGGASNLPASIIAHNSSVTVGGTYRIN